MAGKDLSVHYPRICIWGRSVRYLKSFMRVKARPASRKLACSPSPSAWSRALIISIQNFVHRDLRHQHFSRRCRYPDWRYYPIADFGIAGSKTRPTMTMVGSRYYIAPEISRGERYSASADIFSLGVILNEMDTLQPLQTHQLARHPQPTAHSTTLAPGCPAKVT